MFCACVDNIVYGTFSFFSFMKFSSCVCLLVFAGTVFHLAFYRIRKKNGFFHPCNLEGNISRYVYASKKTEWLNSEFPKVCPQAVENQWVVDLENVWEPIKRLKEFVFAKVRMAAARETRGSFPSSFVLFLYQIPSWASGTQGTQNEAYFQKVEKFEKFENRPSDLSRLFARPIVYQQF